MTAEQLSDERLSDERLSAERLEELLRQCGTMQGQWWKVDRGLGRPTERMLAQDYLKHLAPTLACRVIAAEALLRGVLGARETATAQYKGNLYPENGDGWEMCVNDMLGCLDDGVAAYREASK